MIRTVVFFTFLLFISACSSGGSSGSSQPTADCLCIPNEKTNTPDGIEKMRQELMDRWVSFQPEIGYQDRVIKTGDLNAELGDENQQCLFDISSMSLEASVIDKQDYQGKPLSVWESRYEFNKYTLASGTTAGPEYCKQLAKGVNNFQLLGDVLAALSFLELEKADIEPEAKAKIDEDMPELSYMMNDNDTVVVPQEMTKGTFNGLDVYALTYHLKNADQQADALLTVRFGADVSGHGKMWSLKIDGVSNGQKISVTNNIIDSINGVSVR